MPQKDLATKVEVREDQTLLEAELHLLTVLLPEALAPALALNRNPRFLVLLPRLVVPAMPVHKHLHNLHLSQLLSQLLKLRQWPEILLEKVLHHVRPMASETWTCRPRSTTLMVK